MAAVVLLRQPGLIEGHPAWPWLALIVAAGALGTPIFVILGGAAVLLFMSEGTTPAAVLVETYALSVSPTLPAIPLFTLAGFLLAEGRASERLLRVFRAWFGWIPGGTAVVCAFLCSFFTVFTGGSGVTILALGGVLFPALLKDGYRERFSLGLMTAAGSLGLLLPPALPLILYGVVAQIPIEDLFIGGIVPGFLLTAMIAAWGVREGIVSRTTRHPFLLREGVASLWAAKWELMMPAVVLVAMFSGLATTVEAAALVVIYAIVVQTVVHHDLSLRRDTLRVFTECAVVVGGVLVILGVAVGFTNYLVGAQVPARMLEWCQQHIGSRLDVSLRSQSLSAGRRLADGDLRCHRRRRTAHRAAGRSVRHPPGAPRHHLYCQSRTGVPDAACRHQYLSRVIPFQTASTRGVLRGTADDGDPRSRRSPHHLCAVADDGDSATARPGLKSPTTEVTEENGGHGFTISFLSPLDTLWRRSR